MADKAVVFTAALRCLLVYRTSWNPRECEGLNCFHEENNSYNIVWITHPVITCSKLTIETLEQGVKHYVIDVVLVFLLLTLT